MGFNKTQWDFNGIFATGVAPFQEMSEMSNEISFEPPLNRH